MALDPSNIGASKVEEIAAKNIRNQLIKSVCPVLKQLRDPPDNPEEYRALYGSLGQYLYQGVTKARQQSGGNKAPTAPAAATAPASAVAATPTTPQPGIKIEGARVMMPGAQQQQRVFVVNPQQQQQLLQQQQQQQGIRMVMPGQMMNIQQQQQVQRQFSQPGQNPYQ